MTVIIKESLAVEGAIIPARDYGVRLSFGGIEDGFDCGLDHRRAEFGEPANHSPLAHVRRSDHGGKITAEIVRTTHREEEAAAPDVLEVERYLLVAWKPLHSVSVFKITRRHVAARVADIAAQQGAVSAARARTALSSMFHWGIREGSISKSKAALDARILSARREVDEDAKPLPRWTVHDPRRTAATVMADRLGVLPHIVEAILNHVSGHRAGVAGVYNRARYGAEIQTRWNAGLNI